MITGVRGWRSGGGREGGGRRGDWKVNTILWCVAAPSYHHRHSTANGTWMSPPPLKVSSCLHSSRGGTLRINQIGRAGGITLLSMVPLKRNLHWFKWLLTITNIQVSKSPGVKGNRLMLRLCVVILNGHKGSQEGAWDCSYCHYCSLLLVFMFSFCSFSLVQQHLQVKLKFLPTLHCFSTAHPVRLHAHKSSNLCPYSRKRMLLKHV